MNPFKVLKRVSFKNILKVTIIGMGHPRFLLPTLRATRECLKISNDLYGRSHFKNGPANAFRHVLWNYLIAKRCFAFKKNEKKVLSWTKKITDWHENAFPNNELARKMDLHNNKVGRLFFMTNFQITEDEAIALFQNMTANSLKIDSSISLDKLDDQLVHITEKS
ncbi:DUF6973 domain-containing protein [Flagellimonas nanhaiensis]|uniref:DUF6973 domain-containing protein n=1 Tax=Flagellimonas nanhaiensis TaxID=2292706 RepID=A0A371JR06_9FLAO|nr:hypothetical protein [Allomuricauda nanhaiensis]RDY59940.1 hypothetical protein DX873_11365 [Allomuricauda nanhaiensis]